MSEDRKRGLAELTELSQLFEEIERKYDEDANSWWDSLTEDERQLAFYSVVKRLVKGELRDRGSYRYVLYDVFGFDASSYVMGMNCGYLQLHNHIVTAEEIKFLRDKRYEELGTKMVDSATIKLDK